jgi:heat shock protein HslJ
MRRMTLRLLTLTAALLVSGAGCSDTDLLTAPTSAARVEGTWTLVQLTSTGVSLNEARSASRFALTLAGDRGLLKADCNTCAGDFRLDDDVITLSLQACTRAFCQSSPLDTQVAAALDGKHTVRLDATRLVLTSARGEARFER